LLLLLFSLFADSLQKAVLGAQGIPAVIKHVSSANPNCARMALQTLQNLAINGKSAPASVVIYLFAYLFGGCALINGTLVLLGLGAGECRTNIFMNNGVPKVVAAIRDGNEETLPHALRVVINLTGDGTSMHLPP
jgi:hypothetical protein